MPIRFLIVALCAVSISLAQQVPPEHKAKHHTTAKHDVGSGAGDIGKGVGKGAVSAAKGTGKAAADLVTLHPVNAATDLGRGAVSVGKNVGVGAVKGTGKIVRGTGKALKHIL